jgi:hypothetical protein
VELTKRNSGLKLVEHMATRIPLAWIVLVVIVGIFAFFGYHIAKAVGLPRLLDTASDPKLQAALAAAHGLPKINHLQPTLDLSMPNQPYVPPQMYQQQMPSGVVNSGGVQGTEQQETAAPVMTTRQRPPIAKPMPVPTGMTEEDMRTPEPLQRTPPAIHYDPPEATDPLNRVAFMDAEFGSNLRHPEQMIEHRQRPGVGKMVSSGLGSEKSSPGPHNAAGYSPEMIQNGGDFMQGIGAFDGAEMNSSFSMI